MLRRSQLADPVVLYDKQAGRWLVNIHTLGNPYLICFAVSTSGDATGTYNRYAFQVQALGRATNEQLGVWPDGYYVAQWIPTSSSTYIGPQACAVGIAERLPDPRPGWLELPVPIPFPCGLHQHGELYVHRAGDYRCGAL